MSSINDKRICEYFLISGFNKNRKLYDLSQISYQGEEICNANVEISTDFFHYKEPIVDIQIVTMNQKERPPPGYHVVDRTYSKLNRADLNGKASVDELYLCFRYGRDRPPITDIWAINPKQKNVVNQENWILIEKTVNGHSANLHTSVSNPLFVAYRRAPVNAPVDNLVVTDICVILTNKNEFCPPAYSRVDVPIKRTPLSHTVNICYKKSIVKQYVLTFQPEVIYCLPSSSTQPIVDVYNTDKDKCSTSDCLPEDIRDVANFCMPWGATLESWPSELRTPRPSFVTFVLTNINYDRMYGAAMLFYEDFDKQQLTEEESINLGLRIEGRNNMKIFASKSICLLSRWPLFQTFHRVLSFLIQEDERQRCGVTIDSCPFSLPLERFISQFLHSVPFPTPEAPNILLQWDLEKPIGIQLPTDAISKFGTSENFYHLMRMLDVEEIIQLFVYMITEQKILLTSTCNSDLTGIAEALISMIFPFKWSVVYIPFLYLSCIQIIQSPSPYLIGVDSRFFDYFRLPDGVGCIDLINKSIKPPDSFNGKQLEHNKVLPKAVLRSLRTGLVNCKGKVNSFEKQQNIRKTTGNLIDDFTILRKKEIIGEATRECFLRAVTLMFKNYQKYLVPLSYREKEDDMFDEEAFIKSVDKNSRPLYQAIFDTQLWNHFIMERSYATEFDDSLAFFDRCIKYIQTMDEEQANVSSLLQTDSVIKSEHTKVVPPPDPVEGWSMTELSRNTFPSRLDSQLMLQSSPVSTESPYVLSNTSNSSSVHQTPQDQGSTSNFGTPDSSIPVLYIRASDSTNTPNNPSRRSNKVTVLKRPFEELKQARHFGKEAKRGPSYAWASHVLSSCYSLWYLSLPGLLGYVLDTAGLRDSGLVDRILELAVDMLDSIENFRLVLPDEVCLRVLLLLVHQLKPIRLNVSDILKHADLNAFSYGLCNQILLEEETSVTKQKVILNNSDKEANHTESVNTVDKETEATDGDLRDEKDCDSGRETLASTNNESADASVEQAAQPVVNSEVETGHPEPKSSSDVLDKKSVRLRVAHNQAGGGGAKSRTDRMSQLLFTTPVDTSGEIDSMNGDSHQFFDQSAGIIMSSTPRIISSLSTSTAEDQQQTPPILVLHASPSPSPSQSNKDDNITPNNIATKDISSSSSSSVLKPSPSLLLKSPFSEEKSDLHISYLSSPKSSNGHDDSANSSYDNDNDKMTSSVTTDSRGDEETTLSQDSGLSTKNISIKTRASFRQFKSVATKSAKSFKTMMNSVSSGSWMSPASVDIHHQQQQFGMPATFKPWEQQQQEANISSRRPLKMTASVDRLIAMKDEIQQPPRQCVGTVQQMRRQQNLGDSLGRYGAGGSTESCHSSDHRMDQYSSSNSLDTAEPPIVSVDKIWEKITDSLAAVQLPMGKYWPEEEQDSDGVHSSPSIECTHSLSVRMTTCSECAYCHSIIYDDDIMSGWSYDDSDLQSLCSYCGQRFTPRLAFQVFIEQLKQDSDPSTERSSHVNRLTLAYMSQINYLSPFVLRKELESVLQQEGEVALLRPNFLQEHSILYWNLIWFYSRLNLPTHMLSFLTLWLREKGRWNAAQNKENAAKFEILTSLTGHERVSVVLAWEFNQLSGGASLPLYRRYLATMQSLNTEGTVGPMNTPSRTLMNQLVSALFKSDIRQAIHLVLAIRRQLPSETSSSPATAAVAVAVAGTCSRSAYRELMYMAMIVLYRHSLNLDTFHFMYKSHWDNIVKIRPDLILPYDRPPSDATFYCRKVFRPLILI